MATDLSSVFQELNIKSLSEIYDNDLAVLVDRFSENELENLIYAFRKYLSAHKLLPDKAKRFDRLDMPTEVLRLAPEFQKDLERSDIQSVAQFVRCEATDSLIIQWPMRVRLAVRTRILCVLALSNEEFKALTNFLISEPSPEITESTPTVEEENYVDLKMEVEHLGLSPQARNRLKRFGIDTVEQLIGMSDAELLDIPNIGQVLLAEIRQKLIGYLPKVSPPEQPSQLETASMPVTEEESEQNRLDLTEVDPEMKIEPLDLSPRAFNSLKRVGIDTVEQLIEMSDAELLDIPNIGRVLLAEIRQKLAGYVPKPSPTEQPNRSETTSPANDKNTQPKISVADNTPLSELELPLRIHNLLIRAGIETIGQLMALSRQEILDLRHISQKSADKIEAKLASYLDRKSNSAEPEVTKPDVETRTEEDSENYTLAQMFEIWFMPLKTRQRQILRWRYGLDEDPLTLEETGERLGGLTRERIRQIQFKAVRRLKQKRHRRKVQRLDDLIRRFFEQAGGLLNKTQMEVQFKEAIEIGDINVAGAIQLLLDTHQDVTWLSKPQAWALKEAIDKILLKAIPTIQKRLAKLLEQQYVPIPVEALLAQFKESPYYTNKEPRLPDDFIMACLHAHPDFIEDGQGQVGLEKWTRQRLGQMILVLQQLGEPTHFSEIAEKANSLLPPDQQTTAHNMHAQMQRLPDIFVRVGHGIYGLKEWNLYDDGNLANAAHRVLQEAGRPLRLEFIIDEVLKTWHAKSSSVIAAISLDNRFIRVGLGVYALQEHVQGEVDVASKTDFGDLFGDELARLQTDLDRQQGKPPPDSLDEIDAIRRLGIDLFK